VESIIGLSAFSYFDSHEQLFTNIPETFLSNTLFF
jgi:hypothetical protein